MIQDKEIEQKANEFGINFANVEKDYVNGWLLAALYSESLLGRYLVLKGGNALRKAYLPDTRFSKDLDFSVNELIEPEFLHNELNKTCAFVSDKTNVKFELDKTFVRPKNVSIPDKKILEARAYFKGFYREETITLKIQLDVTQFDKIY